MKRPNNKGFTLLELLIVIALIAILSVIVILVLNPAETLKKARDSQRIADLNTIKTVLGLYLTTTGTPFLGVGGTSNTGCVGSGIKYIWYSKSGVSSTAQRDNSTAWATSTPSQSNAGKTDGSGWIPVNLSSLIGGSPISNFPVDPVNTVVNNALPASTDFVYRYSCNSTNMQFEVSAVLESTAYTVTDNKMANDGGNDSGYYEVGSSLNIMGSGSNNLDF